MRISPFVFALALASPAMVSPSIVRADDDASTAVNVDERQVALAADVGFSGGGLGTPGGMRIGGHYLYRLADHDWFDTSLAFTFGGPIDGCGGAPPDGAVALEPACERASGRAFAGDLSLGLRRELAARRGFTPWLRAAGFVRALRADDAGGLAVGGELGAGVRAPVTGELAIVAGAHGFLGTALGDLAAARQLGLTVSVGAEVGMR